MMKLCASCGKPTLEVVNWLKTQQEPLSEPLCDACFEVYFDAVVHAVIDAWDGS